jgi:hypothetical protein
MQLKYICKEDRIDLYSRLVKSQLVMVDQVRVNQEIINHDRFDVIQQCLSFLHHKSYFHILYWENNIYITEYNDFDRLTTVHQTLWVVNKEIIKKTKKSL